MITKLNFECYLNLETEGKINFLLTSIQWFFTQKKVSLILTKTLSFPQKNSLFFDSRKSHKNANGNSKLIPF